MKRMKHNKVILHMMGCLILTLMLSACGSSGSSLPQYDSAAVFSASPESQSAASDVDPQSEFTDAAEKFSEEQAGLLEDISEAEALLETVIGERFGNTMESEELYLLAVVAGEAEEIENLRYILDEARPVSEITVPDMGSDEQEIRQQAQDIREQEVMVRGLRDDIGNAMTEVYDSHQIWIEEEKQSEIIMVRAELGTRYHYTIYGVDPDTGEQRTVAEFNIPLSVTSNADNSKWQIYPMFLPGWNKRVPLRGMFSADYMYMAVSRYSQDTMECRAGYYREGEKLYYTDVTKSIGAVKGDFDEPVKQMAIGFTEGNQFVLADVPNIPNFYYDTAEWAFSQVDVSDNGTVVNSTLQAFNEADDFLMRGESWEWWPENCELTDWVDDTHCIINYPAESVGLMFGGDRIDRWDVRILDIETQETASFIPGESRSNWGGVISPDGKSVAFLSAPASGTGNAALYVTSIDGGEPRKLCESIPSQRGSTGYIITRPDSGKTVYFLLEWRKGKK